MSDTPNERLLSERLRNADATAFQLGYCKEWADEVAALEARLREAEDAFGAMD